MSLPSHVLERGPRASQPAPNLRAAGNLWCVSDENNILEQTTGLAWVPYSPSAPGVTPVIRPISLTIDGGGSAITTGVKAEVYVPYACTITMVTMLADQTGSIVVDILASTYAGYPGSLASICAAAKPTIAAADKSQDSTLAGWTVVVAAGTVLRFTVDSAATVTRVHLALTVTS